MSLSPLIQYGAIFVDTAFNQSIDVLINDAQRNQSTLAGEKKLDSGGPKSRLAKRG
jgi:hypothetical protein